MCTYKNLVEEKWFEKQQFIDERLKDFDDKLLHNKKTLEEFKQTLKGQLNAVTEKCHRNMHHWRNECRNGFLAVHEGLINMDKIIDGKCLLMEQSLREEIRQIRKMVVLL
ncbi:hypothetical protein Ahia01_000013400 [Argonauta hians]